MGSAQRRARARENLRRSILDAARELFVTEDYNAVSMRRIAEKIEYSPTAIYLHFKDKQEILFCLIEEGFEILSERLERLDTPDPIERLRQGGRIYLDFALTQSHYYKLMFQTGEGPVCEDYLKQKDMGKRAFGFIRGCVAGAVAQGKFRADIPEEILSHVIWASVHGAVTLALAGRLGMLPDEAHEAFFRAVMEVGLKGMSSETA